jgi:hypothetical protein
MTWQDILKQKINWLDAFDKYGFNDGQDYTGQTEEVANFLEREGYTPMIFSGAHNTYIGKLLKLGGMDGDIVLDKSNSHDRDAFPPQLAKLLDDKFGKAVKVTYDF